MPLIFQHDGSRYSIQFNYGNDALAWAASSGKSCSEVKVMVTANIQPSHPNVTECRIVKLNSQASSIVGRTTRSAGDQFNKEVGRRVSLKRALSQLDKPMRTAAWKAYFDRKGK